MRGFMHTGSMIRHGILVWAVLLAAQAPGWAQGLVAPVVSYILPGDQNVVPVGNGGTVPFPDTLVGGTSSATLNIVNPGTTPVAVTSISVGGAAFRVQGLPLFPATIAPGANLQVQMLYRPAAQSQDSGEAAVQFVGWPPVTLQLTGRGIAPVLSYTLESSPISPGATIALGLVDVGQSATRSLVIHNTGTAPGLVTSVTVSGTGFALVQALAFPQNLEAGSSLAIPLSFTPASASPATGAVVINNSDVFALTGSGRGAQLSFSYTTAGTALPLTPGGTISFSPVQVTSAAQVNFTIRNNGTAAGVISNIAAAGAGFSVTNLPALPLSLAPDAQVTVAIRFEPVTSGFISSTLAVDGTTFLLNGSATAPPALPGYTISGVSGNTAPLTQPAVTLRLAAGYPVALVGTLTLSGVNALPADPAVQFASGGRTVNFRIPANSTDAIFLTGPGGQSLGTQIGLQTGTVAGSFTLVPSFATQAGSVDLTPANPATATYSVAPAAPSLIAVQITAATATSLTIQVTGFTTTRNLTGLTLRFLTARGFRMEPEEYSFDLTQAAATWFQSPGSQSVGGQFRLTIPFSFQLPADRSIQTGITGVVATVSNAQGTSAALQSQ